MAYDQTPTAPQRAADRALGQLGGALSTRMRAGKKMKIDTALIQSCDGANRQTNSNAKGISAT